MTPRSPHLSSPAAARFKRDFANRAKSFVKSADRLPGFRSIMLGGLAALFFTTLAGAFGTGPMPWPSRLAFWAMVIGVNMALWMAWFAWRVRQPTDWWRASLSGIPLLTLPLPLEILVALRVVTGEWPGFSPQSWLHGLGVGFLLLAVAFAIHQLWPLAVPPPPVVQGLLFRLGVRDSAELGSIEAEDHYCRLRLVDGRELLVHARFSDLVRELGTGNGIVVRRGVWLSARMAGPIERDGRRLLVTLPIGRQVAASASGREAMREAGWI